MRTLESRFRRTGTAGLLLLGLALAANSGAVLAQSDPRGPAIAGTRAPAADAKSAYLGVRLEEETDHPEGGALVTHVVGDSPADTAGLREGDIIVRFGDATVRGPLALTRKLRAREPGDRVPLGVIREGRSMRLEVELGERSGAAALLPDWYEPSDRWQVWQGGLQDRLEEVGDRLGESFSYSFTVPDGDARIGSFSFAFGKPKLGVQLVETTPELREHLGGSEEAGVLVSKVLQGTPAERAELRVGDLIVSVDGRAVATVDELRDALRDKEGKSFPVEVVRDHRPLSLRVSIDAPEDDRPTGPQARLIRLPAERAPLSHRSPAPPAPAAPPAARA